METQIKNKIWSCSHECTKQRTLTIYVRYGDSNSNQRKLVVGCIDSATEGKAAAILIDECLGEASLDEWVAFNDADTYVMKGWCRKAIKRWQKHTQCNGAKWMRNKTLSQYAGVYSVIRLWITLTGWPQCSPTGCIIIFHSSSMV